MTGFPELRRKEAEATCCLPGLRHFSGCVLACTFGWAWIGILRIQQGRASCPYGGTSVLGSRNNFGCICEPKGRNDEREEARAAGAAWLRARAADIAGANQAHRDARRRHDLKFLSLRGETTPRTPVWRSIRVSQLELRESGIHA